MLLLDERKRLSEEVALLSGGLPTNLVPILGSQHVIRIETAPSPLLYGRKVVRYCEFSAWVEDPALILKLLDLWKVVPPFDGTIVRLKQAGPPIYYTNNRPYETCLLALDLPFINREVTRKAVELFRSPVETDGYDEPGVRVLIVNGPPGSGKTFTYGYISYINSIFAGLTFKTAYIDYKKYPVSRFGPEQLCESILSIIAPGWTTAASLPVLDAQQKARWHLQLAKFIGEQIAATGNCWWILLDHFDKSDVPRETIEFIQVLAKLATGEIHSDISNDVVRLVVMGYTEPILNYKRRVLTEDIQDVTRDDIHKYFERYLAFKKIDVQSSDIDYLVDETFKKDPGGIPKRTEILAKEALAIARKLA